eukprot:15110163-Ditylum_brightwellii.AAC.1
MMKNRSSGVPEADALNGSDPSPQLLQLEIDLDIPPDSFTIDQIRSKLTASRKDLWKVQQNAVELGDKYLEERATLQACQSNTDLVVISKNLWHQEKIIQAFELMIPISKGAEGEEVSCILVPDKLENTSMYGEVLTGLKFQLGWILIDDDNQVMPTFLLQNKLHLHQKYDTTCAIGNVKGYIDKYGLGNGTKDILDRNFDPNINANLPAVNQWLQHHIRRVATPGSICVELSLDEYKGLIKSQDD